eukprot:CAMPEP_0194528096 /NCGR_PEP_ID=MMETSP0253-20130528/64415_1 /TAXON_ID=2966 /ORGANISM="Noctiluca scintillans" /LENGTH=117 /DNA_ID=CAMNT_0039373121 /DNA_START=142 /DNA_END=495 /DNA_ORIENTATION=-
MTCMFNAVPADIKTVANAHSNVIANISIQEIGREVSLHQRQYKNAGMITHEKGVISDPISAARASKKGTLLAVTQQTTRFAVTIHAHFVQDHQSSWSKLAGSTRACIARPNTTALIK